MAANDGRSVLVVGLGRFGAAVATMLDDLNVDVLAVDRNPETVARWSNVLPTLEADMTDPLATEQVDAGSFDSAVVAIGDSVEASVLVTGNLLDAGVSDVWAKSVSQQHARILQRIGANHVINAETDAGRRVGHLITTHYLDYIEIEGPYSVVKIRVPRQVRGKTIAEAQVHERYGVTIVGLKAPGKEFKHGSSDIVLEPTAELVVLGTQDQIDHFIQGQAK